MTIIDSASPVDESVANRLLEKNQTPVKPAALFIVAHAPSARARQAGQKTAQMHLDKLRQGYDVETIIMCSTTIDELKNAALCETTIRVVPFYRFKKAISVLAGLIHGIPPRFATRFSHRVARDIAMRMNERRYQLVWLEYSQVFWLLPSILGTGDGSMKIVVSLQDVQTEVVSRKSKIERTLFGAWTRAYERKVTSGAMSVIVLSGKDRDLIRRLCGPSVKIEVSTPVMSDFVYRVRRRDELIRPFSLLFWGAMNRTENYSAAIWFSKHALPSIRQRFPQAVFFIVGANPPRQLQSLASDHVIVTGYVEDPTPYFVQASLGIVPLAEGAGIKLKTLEMLEAGLKVVSTEIGAEGIVATDNLIVTDIHAIADVVMSLMSQSASLANL